jgi:hypothetical protein
MDHSHCHVRARFEIPRTNAPYGVHPTLTALSSRRSHSMWVMAERGSSGMPTSPPSGSPWMLSHSIPTVSCSSVGTARRTLPAALPRGSHSTCRRDRREFSTRACGRSPETLASGLCGRALADTSSAQEHNGGSLRTPSAASPRAAAFNLASRAALAALRPGDRMHAVASALRAPRTRRRHPNPS